MAVAEAEPIGGFVGMAISEPLLQAGMLMSVIGYMAYLEPWTLALKRGLLRRSDLRAAMQRASTAAPSGASAPCARSRRHRRDRHSRRRAHRAGVHAHMGHLPRSSTA